MRVDRVHPIHLEACMQMCEYVKALETVSVIGLSSIISPAEATYSVRTAEAMQ